MEVSGMLKRKAYDQLLEWKSESAGKTAMLIEGARRVGKSTLGKSARMRTYEEAFFWLADARIANMCYAASDPSVGLALSRTSTSLQETRFYCFRPDWRQVRRA